MHKLLIVDDEKWVRDGLRHLIPWDTINVEIAGAAWDGEEALELIKQHQPAIVITDIAMPYMDGLQLIDVLKERYAAIKTVIISGYGEFEYAQRALQMGVTDYILKPIEEHYLIEVIRKCVAEIEERKADEAREKHIRHQLDESLPALKERLFQDLCLGNEIDDGVVQKLALLDLDIDECSRLVSIVEIDHEEQAADKMTDREFRSHYCNLQQHVLQLLPAAGKVEVFQCIAGQMVLLHKCGPDERTAYKEWILEHARELRSWANETLGISVTIGLGSWCAKLQQLGQSYAHARQALQFKLYQGKNQIIDIDDVNFDRPRCGVHGLEYERRIVHDLRQGAFEKAEEAFHEFIADTLKHKSGGFDEIRLVFFSLVNAVLHAFHDKANRDMQELSDERLLIYKQMKDLETISDMVRCFVAFMTRLTGYTQQNGAHRNRKLIANALQFIRERYSRELTLKDVADYVYLTPSYFSKLFKDEVGENFSKYLMKLRVEEAKRLLTQSNLKIYEIGAGIGYPNTHYFIKVFKELEGITPAQYREDPTK